MFWSDKMNLKNKKILVTGADGFIGSHLVENLVLEGYDVRAFVYYNSFNSWGWIDYFPKEIKKSLEIFEGDIRDSYLVKRAMKGCQVVFNLAALVSVPYSYKAPKLYMDTNIGGLLNILEGARELNTERIVHTSTSEVYGTAKFVPISETHPLNGQSPYAASKIGADQMALSFYNSFDVPVSIIRPFNTYGPRQLARAVIPTIITQIAEGVHKIKLGALTPTRDFNYVKDVVWGFIKVAMCDDAVGDVVNIGSGYEISIGDTGKIIAEIMGKEVEFVQDAQRLRPSKSEVQRLVADISKAKKLLGFTLLYGGKEGFRKGLEETVNWFSNKENLKLYKSYRYNL